MKYSFLTLLMLSYYLSPVFGQPLSQTVRGTLTDADSQMPLIGATVMVSGSNPAIATFTDVDGKFRLTNIPIGRITLQLSYLGYEPKAIPDVVVNSGKEAVLNLSLQESAIKLTEVLVTANQVKGQAQNDMALISARSISPEETSRYAGGFNDPSAIVSNFAGIANNPNGNNDIIVRGNSPKYVQWRLEGTQITNPNHFADQGAIGGGLSTLNNNKLRAGNNEKLESVVGVGILGTEATVEGPFKKGYGGSFLVNYRYSTISLLTDLGLTKVKGNPNFQDAAFKMVLPTKKMGAFSFFGLGGASNAFLKEVKPEVAETPGDRAMLPGIREDLEKGSFLLNLGMNHTLPLGPNNYLHTSISYSREGIKDQVFESSVLKQYDTAGGFLRDSVLSTVVNYKSHLFKSTYRGALTYHHKLDARNKIQIGTQYALVSYNDRQSELNTEFTSRVDLLEFQKMMGTIRNYISWKHRFNEAITLVTGLQNMNVLYNKKSTLEPRISANWQVDATNSFQIGYGKHSTMESAHNYFAKVTAADGTVSEPNHNLGLLKAHHFVLGYQKRFSENLTARVETYYQNLYNLPVENKANSTFATINEGPDFNYVALVNKGTGKNFGVELTLERFFKNNFYYLINASLYSSTYKTLEGKQRNTPYNGHYLVNVLFGKEFVKLGRNKNQTLGLNSKLFLSGAKNIIPLLRDDNGKLAVDPARNQFWDTSKAYETSLGALSKLVLSVNYKWDKAKATHELFLNLDNVSNAQGKITEYYDPGKPGSVGHTTQRGLVPNLMYRLYF
jgi:hypothetical protein